jgi:hypothetical protein
MATEGLLANSESERVRRALAKKFVHFAQSGNSDNTIASRRVGVTLLPDHFRTAIPGHLS